MTENMKHSVMILGEVASSGVARGPAFVCACVEQTTVPRRVINETETQKEMEKLDAAISEAEKELLDLQKKVQQKAGTQNTFLRRKFFFCTISHCVRRSYLLSDEKINVEAAVDEATETDVLVYAVGRPLFSRAGCGLAGCRKTAARHSDQMPTIGDPQHS